MQIHEVMQRDVVTINDSDELALAVQIMLWRRIRHLPVMRDGVLVGVLSERQVLNERAGRLSAEEGASPVREWMTSPAITVAPTASLAEASALMVTHKISSLPVVEGGELVGIVTSSDLLRHMAWDEAPRDETVAAVATRRLQVLTPDDYALDAVAKMVQSGIRHIPVIDSKRRLVGMLSDRDLRAAAGDPVELMRSPERMDALSGTRVRDLMVPNPTACRMDTPIDDVVEAFCDLNVGALPVVNEDDILLGVVSYVDVLHSLVLRRRRGEG